MNLKQFYTLAFTTVLGSALLQAQTVTTFAGKENTIDPWTNFNNVTTDLADAYFYEPEGIAWDANGVMYITERNKVRIVQGGKVYNRSGDLGDGTKSHGYLNGTGVAGSYFRPTSLAPMSSGDMLIVDCENHALRKLSAFVNIGNGQVVSTFAGANPSGGIDSRGTAGHVDASGAQARFDSPKGIVADGKGNFYVCDDLNFVIRKVTSNGAVTTIAGQAGSDGSVDASSGAASRFGGPYGIAMYDANHVVVTDNWNSSIRKVNITTGATTTICGKYGENWYKDGSLTEARFVSPKGIVVVDGLIYVADQSCIRVIDEVNKTVSTFAGNGASAGNTDGNGQNARFGRLAGLAFDGNNALYATDVYFNVIRKITIDNLSPTADFSATKTSLQIDEETTITDISGGKPATQRKWTVVDLSGSNSNVTLVSGDLNSSKDITVKFKATGFYSVKLEVTNEYGNDVEDKNSFINVSRTGSVRKYNALTGVTVYPNPSIGTSLNLKNTHSSFSGASVSIYDLNGTLVFTENDLNGAQIHMELPGLSKGIYMLVLEQNGESGAHRLVIQ